MSRGGHGKAARPRERVRERADTFRLSGGAVVLWPGALDEDLGAGQAGYQGVSGGPAGFAEQVPGAGPVVAGGAQVLLLPGGHAA